jgi:hypothetical protein
MMEYLNRAHHMSLFRVTAENEGSKMKKIILALILCSIALSSFAFAEDFLGAPVPKGKVTLQTDARLEMTTPLTHDEIVKYYREALKEHEDIKFRDWKNSTYIEDDGRLKWHSITITKNETPASIIIAKDNWTWIIGTLLLRYIAVFIVLMVLFLGMSLSGKIISHLVQKADKAKQKSAA